MSKPIDSGAWKLQQESIYYTEIPETVNFLFVDSLRMNVSDYPAGISNFLYLEEDQTAYNKLTLPKGVSISDLKRINGSRMILRSRLDVYEYNKIIHVDETNRIVTLYQNVRSLLKNGWGVKFTSKKWMLSSGSFSYENGENRLYMKLPIDINKSTPSVFSWEYVPFYSSKSEIQVAGFLISNCENVTVENIQIHNSFDAGISIFKSRSICIKNCVVRNAGAAGIQIQGYPSSNIDIISSSIYNSGQNGISVNEGSAIKIEDNEIIGVFKTGFLADSNSWKTKSMGMGIDLFCIQRCLVTRNKIENTGWSGIQISGSFVRVEHNFINNTCSLLSDGAGILVSGANHFIGHNLVDNSQGNSFGTEFYPIMSSYGQAHGIFCEAGSQNSTIVTNLILNVYYGIFMHISRNYVVSNNTVFSSRNAAGYFKETLYSQQNSFMTKIFVNGNVFHSLSEYVLRIEGYVTSIDFFSELDNNVYFKDKFYIYSPALGERKIAGIKHLHLFSENIKLVIAPNGWEDNGMKLGNDFQSRHDPELDMLLLSNPSLTNFSFYSNIRFCNARGVVIEKLNLEPLSGSIVLKCFCNNDLVCNNRESIVSCPSDCFDILLILVVVGLMLCSCGVLYLATGVIWVLLRDNKENEYRVISAEEYDD